jgi:hypothetical protein
MQLDTALRFAVMQAWGDLTNVNDPCSIRVEYQCDPGTPLDCLKIWSDGGGGCQHLVCDYWTWSSPTHANGVRFRNGYHSDKLGQILDFIMKNQDQFTRRADACRDGLILIDPPTEGESTEAYTWMRGLQSGASNVSRVADERVATL